MNPKEVWYKCPQCHKAFTLKGAKLKSWLNKKSKKASTPGPFCGYECSGKHNINKARKAKKAKSDSKK